jgi:hypothetical protein
VQDPNKGWRLKTFSHTYINFDVYDPVAVPNPHRRKTPKKRRFGSTDRNQKFAGHPRQVMQTEFHLT